MTLRTYYDQVCNCRTHLFCAIGNATFLLEKMIYYRNILPLVEPIFKHLRYILTFQYCVDNDRVLAPLYSYIKKITDDPESLFPEEKEQIEKALVSQYKDSLHTSYFWVQLIKQSLAMIKQFAYIYTARDLTFCGAIQKDLYQGEALLKDLDPQ